MIVSVFYGTKIPDIYIPEYLVEVTKMEDSRRCQHDVKAHITKPRHLYFHSIAQMWLVRGDVAM